MCPSKTKGFCKVLEVRKFGKCIGYVIHYPLGYIDNEQICKILHGLPYTESFKQLLVATCSRRYYMTKVNFGELPKRRFLRKKKSNTNPKPLSHL